MPELLPLGLVALPWLPLGEVVDEFVLLDPESELVMLLLVELPLVPVPVPV